MNLGIQIARVAASLALVLIVLFAGIYALRRWGQWIKRSNPTALIQVLAQHSLGSKHFLMVVKVHEESYLVGVSPQGMNLISTVTCPTAGSSSPGCFAEKRDASDSCAADRKSSISSEKSNET